MKNKKFEIARQILKQQKYDISLGMNPFRGDIHILFKFKRKYNVLLNLITTKLNKFEKSFILDGEGNRVRGSATNIISEIEAGKHSCNIGHNKKSTYTKYVEHHEECLSPELSIIWTTVYQSGYFVITNYIENYSIIIHYKEVVYYNPNLIHITIKNIYYQKYPDNALYKIYANHEMFDKLIEHLRTM